MIEEAYGSKFLQQYIANEDPYRSTLMNSDLDMIHVCLILEVEELFSEESWKQIDSIDVFLTTK